MINLLPPKEKRAIFLERRFRMILIFGVLFFASLCFLTLLLFSTKTFFSHKIRSGKEKLAQQKEAVRSSEIKALRERVSSLQKEISKTNSFFENQVFLVDVLEQISNLLPKGTYLTSFTYQGERKEITISGYAPTREVLFELKQRFEGEEKITNFYFPPLNWIEPKEVKFFLSFGWEEL